MLVLGLLAIVQMAFLPGFLLVYGLRLCRGPLRIFTCSFCLSALLNFFLVYLCLLLGIYTRGVLHAVVASEILLLLYLFYRRGVLQSVIAGETPHGDTQESRPSLPNAAGTHWNLTGLLKNPQSLLGVAALALIAISCCDVYSRLGDTFSHVDVVQNWNRWAIEIAANDWPTMTWSYPQLVPANYSISYVLTGQDTIWFFSKVWIAMFFPVLLLSMYQLYREEGRWELALAVVIAFWLFYRIMTAFHIYDAGHVDIALPTFVLNAVACLHRAAARRSKTECKRELVIGALLAAAAALTKQGGLLLLIAYPILAGLLIGRGCEPEQRRQLHRFLWLVVLLMMLAVLPWYVSPCLDQSSHTILLNHQLTECHGDRSITERVLHSVDKIARRITWPVFAVMTFFLAASFAAPSFRTITLTVALPYCLFWAIGFSYDCRNLALALPLLALPVAMGVGVVWTRLELLIAPTRLISPAHLQWCGVGLLGLAALLWFNQYFSPTRLESLHTKVFAQSYGDATLNQFLSEYLRSPGRQGSVLTNYPMMAQLPKLKDHCNAPCSGRAAALADYVDRLQQRQVRFLLIDRLRTCPEVLNYVGEGTRSGKFEPVFRSGRDRYLFCRKLYPPQPNEMQAARRRPRTSPDTVLK